MASGRKTVQDLNRSDVEALLRINEGKVGTTRGAAKADFEANVKALREALDKFQ